VNGCLFGGLLPQKTYSANIVLGGNKNEGKWCVDSWEIPIHRITLFQISPLVLTVHDHVTLPHRVFRFFLMLLFLVEINLLFKQSELNIKTDKLRAMGNQASISKESSYSLEEKINKCIRVIHFFRYQKLPGTKIEICNRSNLLHSSACKGSWCC